MFRRCDVLVGLVATNWILGMYVYVYMYVYLYIYICVMDLIIARKIERFKVSKLYSALT